MNHESYSSCRGIRLDILEALTKSWVESLSCLLVIFDKRYRWWLRELELTLWSHAQKLPRYGSSFILSNYPLIWEHIWVEAIRIFLQSYFWKQNWNWSRFRWKSYQHWRSNFKGLPWCRPNRKKNTISGCVKGQY